jgi:hypothetical protein
MEVSFDRIEAYKFNSRINMNLFDKPFRYENRLKCGIK